MKKYAAMAALMVSGAMMGQGKLGNPIVNHMDTADPSARVFHDTLWVYPSHDKDDAVSFSMEDYHVFSTTDMMTWTDHGVIFNPLTQTSWAKEAAWAPDCIERNGKYYLYYPTDKKHIGFVIGDNYNYSKEVTSLDNQGVDNYSFTSLCCKAIQELSTKVEELENKIKEMEENDG